MNRLLGAPLPAVIGSLLIFSSGAGYGIGFPHINTGLATLTSLGIICLIAAAFAIVWWSEEGLPSPPNPSRYYGVMLLGFAMILSGQFVALPVGCNLANSCPGNPEGTWSTIWPNALFTFAGVVMVAWGFGKARSGGSQLVGLGLGMAIGGFILLTSGLSIGYITHCPANGCPPLTMNQWWALFWPDVIAEVSGAVCIVAGLTLATLGLRRNQLERRLSINASASLEIGKQA